jgi:hypothetical protein
LWGSLKDKVHNTNPHTLEELRNISHELQQFLGKNSRQQIACSACMLTAFGQAGNIFSTCCSTGEFLLDFPKVTVTVNLFSIPSPTFKPPETWRVT